MAGFACAGANARVRYAALPSKGCAMEVTDQCVVALTWVLKDTLGETLDVLDTPVEFLVGGDDLLARIEQALQGYSAGASVQLHLEPEDAFGDYDEQRVFLAARNLFPETLEEGMTFEGHALPAGSCPDAPTDALYTVTELYPEHVVLDGNHPLAGIARAPGSSASSRQRRVATRCTERAHGNPTAPTAQALRTNSDLSCMAP